MIFVTIGSQLPFNRLLKQVQKEISEGHITEKVIVQCGNSKIKSDKIEFVKFLDIEKFNEIIAKANIVITHGGVGSIIDALKVNKIVIATPRLEKYGEAVNDHQIQIIENFGKMGYIIPLLDLKDMSKALEQAKNFKPKKYNSNTTNMVNLIENYIDKN